MVEDLTKKTTATLALQKQLKELTKNPIPGFRVKVKKDNLLEWEVGIIGPPDTIYEGGYFVATLLFPNDFPYNPPDFYFKRPLYHPNVYNDGRLCISILHPPGDDPTSGESAAERWNPTQSVESILLSIVSLLADPNTSSPANVDAGIVFRNDRAAFESIIRKQVELSKEDIPDGMILPITTEEFIIKPPTEDDEDDDFWLDNGYCDEDDEDMDDS